MQGALILTMSEYRITTGIRSAAMLTILLSVVSALLAWVLWLLVTASGALGRRMNARRKRFRNDSLSRGFIAAATGDVPFARCPTTRRLCTLMGEIERLEGHDTWPRTRG